MLESRSMKKVLAIIILGIAFIGNAFALSQQQAISQYLSDRPLDNIEGIYRSTSGKVHVVTKSSGNNYNCIAIKTNLVSPGTLTCSLNGSGNRYSGTFLVEANGQLQNINGSYETFNDTLNLTVSFAGQTVTKPNAYTRIRPSDIKSHNAKFANNSGLDPKITFNISEKREQCEAIGFKPKTEKFADCVLKLVELDVKQKADSQMSVAQNTGDSQIANQLMQMRNDNNAQYLIDLGQQLLTPQSSNSNIYLPQTQNCTIMGFGSFAKMNCN